MALLRVVIPENTEVCRTLWKAARKAGILLEVFPGFLGVPKGILAQLESEEFHEKYAQGDPDLRFVVLSNGWTVTLTRADIQLL